jgi:hypothetical protein
MGGAKEPRGPVGTLPLADVEVGEPPDGPRDGIGGGPPLRKAWGGPEYGLSRLGGGPLALAPRG